MDSDEVPSSQTAFSEEVSIQALLLPYRNPVYCYQRSYRDVEVRSIVVALTRIIRLHASDLEDYWAIVLAQLLYANEPLEQLAVDDLPCYKMRLFLYCHEKCFNEAFAELDCSLTRFPEDSFFGKMAYWLCRLVLQSHDEPGGNQLQNGDDKKSYHQGGLERHTFFHMQSSVYHCELFPVAKQRKVLVSVRCLLMEHIQGLQHVPNPPLVVLQSVALLLIMAALQELGEPTVEHAQRLDQGGIPLCVLRVATYLRYLSTHELDEKNARQVDRAACDLLYLIIQRTCPHFLAAVWKRPE